MCGLVGVAGNLAFKDEASIKRLLLFDYLRGNDSVGMASIRNNGEVKIAKLANDPLTLFDSNAFKQALSGMNSKVLMGHNRAATTGGKNNFNAHPFHYDHIVGAHNGTLSVSSWNALEKALDEKFAVDSQALIAAIAKLGIKEAIGLCTEGRDSQSGAWSLVWYNQLEGSLNFLRNQWRPMWLAYEKEFKRLFYASEWWMIDANIRASASNSIGNGTPDYELHADPKEGWRFFPTDVDRHYKFDVGLIIAADSKPKPKVQTIKGKEPLPVVATTVSDDPFGRVTNVCGFVPKQKNRGTHTSSSTTSTTTSRGGKNGSSDNVIHWLANASNPLAGYVDKDKFEALAKYGCSWCQADVAFGDPGVTIYERDDLLLCGGCSGHDVVDEDTPCRIYATAGNFNSLR